MILQNNLFLQYFFHFFFLFSCLLVRKYFVKIEFYTIILLLIFALLSTVLPNNVATTLNKVKKPSKNFL